MKKILVASDFSACAANALVYSLELAKALNFEIIVLHVINPTEGINNNTYDALYIEEYYTRKREALSAWSKNYSKKEKFKAVSISTQCQVGLLSTVIKKFIDQNPVAFLVMGTMGSSGINGLFGSNAQNMVEKTKTPTLIIPLESKFLKKPIITLATDFSSSLSHEDIMGMNELLSAVSTKKLQVINIIQGNEWKKNTEGENKMKKLIPKGKLDFKYIQENTTLDGIMNFILTNKTDIICLVKHHHNLIYRVFNRSTVNQVLNKPIRAVLVLHE